MSTPLHLAISEQLRCQILGGDYPPGEQLPSEYQLVERFGVSRTTIRQAIANLISQGLVVSRQGKGVFVTERRKVTYSLSSPMVFLEADMAQQGISLLAKRLESGLVEVPVVAQHLFETPTAYFQKKLLEINGAPGALDLTYVPPPFETFFAVDSTHQMTFPVLEQHGIAIARIEAILECTYANPEESLHLEVPLGHPLIVYRHTAFTTGDRPIAYGETISRGDRFCYSLEIRRGESF
ncbi:GntR family transcriptional regulator [Thermoleptolyngbya oregonensis NK1-22]|uniref:GntR family transcriptional regulator n=1 Tax=Thermoleptolyngbya oregonensis NK1-22 TaxID=2547457 RepID=A0AA96Y534_9CYAN|nr:GntR family transcriptional regulator [Thermoleptolyngbya oregonensis]WOB43634.1 GntR family transcriptional regulator [Thermoleptolyngbya oregonensis NK1-22]